MWVSHAARLASSPTALVSRPEAGGCRVSEELRSLGTQMAPASVRTPERALIESQQRSRLWPVRSATLASWRVARMKLLGHASVLDRPSCRARRAPGWRRLGCVAPAALSRPVDSMVAPVLGGGDPRLLGRRERRRVVDGIWRVRNSLPLQRTDGVSLCAILALLTQQQLLIELVYFWSFSPSLQAVLTPDLGSTFPSVLYFTLPISSTTLARSWPRACWCSAAADIHASARSGACTG